MAGTDYATPLTHKQIAALPEDETALCPACGRPLKRLEQATPQGGTFVRLTCGNDQCAKYRGRDPR